eukprot:scaffold1712_cov261-Pinguiococcus_pyrenoidosus.AAC.16
MLEASEASCRLDSRLEMRISSPDVIGEVSGGRANPRPSSASFCYDLSLAETEETRVTKAVQVGHSVRLAWPSMAWPLRSEAVHELA